MRTHFTRQPDLGGQVFGELTVLARAVAPEGLAGRHRYYLCRCSCGTERVMRANAKYMELFGEFARPNFPLGPAA